MSTTTHTTLSQLEKKLARLEDDIENARYNLRDLEDQYDHTAAEIRELEDKQHLESLGLDDDPTCVRTIERLARLVLEHEDASGAVRDLAQAFADGESIYRGDDRLIAAASNLGIFYEGA